MLSLSINDKNGVLIDGASQVSYIAIAGTGKCIGTCTGNLTDALVKREELKAKSKELLVKTEGLKAKS